MVLGLTGQTGAGKSTVSDILRAETGVTIIDADQVARDVMSKGTNCLAEIALEFTIEVLNADGTLNRQRLAKQVFNDRDKLRRLNAISFPHILAEIKAKITEAQNKGAKLVVLDAPTLLESKADRLCEKVVVVIADPVLRKNRIIKRDRLSTADAESRMSSQRSQEYYTKRADYIIDNAGDMPALRLQILELLAQLK